MKIGLITYHRALNYGAVLQAYALQKVINEILDGSGECKILDYKCEKIEDMGVAVHKDKRFCKDIIKVPFRAGNLKQKRKAYKSFVSKYIDTCSAERSELADISEDFDLFITGSDQLWNYAICGDDDAYFLDFVKEKKKKYSYAVSLGAKRDFLRDKERILDNLRDFSCISLREGICVDELKRINENIRTDIDPTLLLEPKSYEKAFGLVDKSENYILVYCVAPPKNIMDNAQRLAKKKGLKVVILTEKISDRLKYPECECVFGKGPIEFLSLIKNASYVFTTSFHAAVFSLKFHKNVYAEIENASGHNDRINNLINVTGAHPCSDESFLLDGGELSENEWLEIDLAIAGLGLESKKYLRNIIKDN